MSELAPESAPQHTFGGSRMDRYVFDFEEDITGGLDGGGVADVAAPDADAPEPAWAPSQQEWEAVTQGLGYLYQQSLPQQQTPAIDPYADDFQTQLDQYFESRLQQHLGPIQQFQQHVQLGEAEERAMDILTDIQTREGEFLLPDSAQRARQLANEYVGPAVAKYGQGAKAAEAALSQAYTDVKAWEQEVGKAYYQREMNQIRGLSSAPREPNAAGQANQSVAVPQGGNELDLVRSYFNTR